MTSKSHSGKTSESLISKTQGFKILEEFGVALTFISEMDLDAILQR